MTPDELDAAILVRGQSFPLANGWKLARRSIAHIDRIEVEGPTDADLPRAQSASDASPRSSPGRRARSSPAPTSSDA